jgi:hypothetical protein
LVTFYQRFGDVGCWVFGDGHLQVRRPCGSSPPFYDILTYSCVVQFPRSHQNCSRCNWNLVPLLASSSRSSRATRKHRLHWRYRSR